MRELCTVIEQMIKQIPDSEEEFISHLRSAQDSARYSAPESMKLRWQMTAQVLYHFIPYPQENDWQKKIVAIWMMTE